MEIGAIKIIEPTVSYSSTTKNDSTPTVKSGETGAVGKNSTSEQGKLNNQPNDDAKAKKDLNKDELTQVNTQLNQFMSLINSDLQFSIHEKSKQLMVQVVDSKEHKVLKEFPSHEMLDIMANIKDYVGALLDKRA